MTDRQLRLYERDPGCLVARAGFLSALVRSGGVASSRVGLRAYAGDPIAQRASGISPPRELRAWALGLRAWNRAVRFVAAFAAVQLVEARHRDALEAGLAQPWGGDLSAESSGALATLVEFVEWNGQDARRLARVQWPVVWQPYWSACLVRDLATFLRKSTRSASAAAKCLVRASESPVVGADEVRAAVERALLVGFPLDLGRPRAGREREAVLLPLPAPCLMR